MKRKELLLIKLIVASFFIALCITGVFFVCSTNIKKIKNDELIVIEKSEQVKLQVKQLKSDYLGNITIVLLAKNDNIRYPYHNWTLWDGEGVYKNIRIIFLQNDELLVAKTYPCEIELSESDIQNGFTEKDGCLCYMRGVKLEDDYKIGVIFCDREDNQYVIYQE